MLLSILITHYNRPDALKSCLDSVYNMKLYFPFEVLVIDDCSTINTLNQIKNYKIDNLIISDKNMGLASSLNKGIKACNGNYIFYCQEDFLILPELSKLFDECFSVLSEYKLDMIRFRANYKFPKLINISENIFRIPKFSLRNFKVNAFQYSDNSFIVNKNFFTKYGYYLVHTSGPYGETEYAIRIFNSSAKIGITKKQYVVDNKKANSVMKINYPIIKRRGSKQMWKYLRALRLHLELIFYSKTNRKLITYKNKRK